MSRYIKLYEDTWLLIIDKPAKLLTVPAFQKSEISLLDLLNSEYSPKKIKIFPCHRLDKETSGLVIFAKDKRTQKEIMDLFRLREVKKKYVAIVHGWLRNNSVEIKSYLSESVAFGKRRRLAVTRLKVIKKNPEYSIVEVEPLTGRRNQIRIHFRQIGHPIVGERRFAFAKDFALRAKRLCLHSWQLDFFHPRTNRRINLRSPLPGEIKKFF